MKRPDCTRPNCYGVGCLGRGDGCPVSEAERKGGRKRERQEDYTPRERNDKSDTED